MKKTTKKAGGPKSGYSEDFVKIGNRYAALGAIDTELASNFGIAVTTLNMWKKKHPEFREAIQAGKDEFNMCRAEGALIHSSLGYTHTETKVFYDKDQGIVTYDVEKHYPPNVTALIFFLKNRDPKRWRDVHKIDLEVDTEKIQAAFKFIDVESTDITPKRIN